MKAYAWASIACLYLTACTGSFLGDGGTFPDDIDTLRLPNMNIAGTYTLTFTAARRGGVYDGALAF